MCKQLFIAHNVLLPSDMQNVVFCLSISFRILEVLNLSWAQKSAVLIESFLSPSVLNVKCFEIPILIPSQFRIVLLMLDFLEISVIYLLLLNKFLLSVSPV